MNKFLTDNYDAIIIMAKKICKASSQSEEVAHFAISQFIEHERGQELVDSGRAMAFLSGIIWRSFNSSTSQYILFIDKRAVCILCQRATIIKQMMIHMTLREI